MSMSFMESARSQMIQYITVETVSLGSHRQRSWLRFLGFLHPWDVPWANIEINQRPRIKGETSQMNPNEPCWFVKSSGIARFLQHSQSQSKSQMSERALVPALSWASQILRRPEDTDVHQFSHSILFATNAAKSANMYQLETSTNIQWQAFHLQHRNTLPGYRSANAGNLFAPPFLGAENLRCPHKIAMSNPVSFVFSCYIQNPGIISIGIWHRFFSLHCETLVIMPCKNYGL